MQDVGIGTVVHTVIQPGKRRQLPLQCLPAYFGLLPIAVVEVEMQADTAIVPIVRQEDVETGNGCPVLGGRGGNIAVVTDVPLGNCRGAESIQAEKADSQEGMGHGSILAFVIYAEAVLY